MGSVVSSENEGPPSLGEDCGTCGHVYNWHYSSDPKKCTADDDKCGCSGFTRKPKGSEGSSSDEHQHCWHYRPEVSGDQCCGCFETQRENASASDFCGQCKHHRRYHEGKLCTVCPAFTKDNEHVFVETKAEPKTAGEPQAPHEHDWTEWGSTYHGGHMRWRECQTCHAREGTKVGHECPECTSEPEALECEGCEHPDHGDEPCGQCPCGHPVPTPVVPSRAVAYATGSGALYELVLPGEMTCAVVDGVLVLSHPSGVLGIQQVKPMEGA